MLGIRSSIKAFLITISAFVMTCGLPLASMASASADDCTPPPSTQPGVHWPTGSEAPTYTYQCDGQYAGKWTNAYYVYDPDTSTKYPLYAPDYQYECPVGGWTKVEYEYSPARGIYYATRVASADPGLPTGCPAPTDNPTTGSGSPLATASVANGASTANNSNTTANNTLNGSNNTSINMNNGLSAISTSGNANIIGNLTAGSANTGDATSIANIVNLLQSSSNSLGTNNNMILFTTDIDGDVNGDLMLDPGMLSQVQPASNSNSTSDLNNKLTINNSTDANINNSVDVLAGSGDATVSKNNQAGSATTGNAKAVADIVNIVNTAITSGQSFIGVVNINGNLNGDILLPDNFVDQLVAANVPTVTIASPGSTNSDSTTVNNDANVTNTNSQAINNNVNATAKSGNATVSNNNQAGSATTGNAAAKITAFNLTGSNVIGSNALLVFVNNLGTWVGLIVNAPAGSSAAALGGGLSQNTTNVNNDVGISNTTKHTINNDINAAAQSGDATVDRNLKAGDAKSGDADAAVNIANISNSTISLSGWLGILFINVFGSWNGSFGVNTSAGDPITHAVAQAQQSGSSSPQVFRFVPSAGGSGGGYDVTPYTANGVGPSSTDNSSSTPTNALLANARIKDSQAPTPQLQDSNKGLGITPILIVSAVVLYILGDAAYTRRHPERA